MQNEEWELAERGKLLAREEAFSKPEQRELATEGARMHTDKFKERHCVSSSVAICAASVSQPARLLVQPVRVRPRQLAEIRRVVIFDVPAR
jgi:hypothetical protein